MEIGRHKANDLTMSSRFWQHVVIAAKNIAKTHAIDIRKTSRARYMPLQVDCPLTVRQDGGDVDAVSIFYRKRNKRLSIVICAHCR